MDKALRQQRLYYARRELGLCVKCGMPAEYRNNHKYTQCADCRRKARERWQGLDKKEYSREYMRKYQEDSKRVVQKLAIMTQNLLAPKDLFVQRKAIPDDHKCWNCVWSRWHGDRFFCPLVGCVKEPMKREEQNVVE